MESPNSLVRNWLSAFGKPTDVEPTDELRLLAIECIREESREVMDELSYDKSVHSMDKEALTKELCDLLWVTHQAAAFFGLPIEEAFQKVYESNMSKLGEDGKPILREDGKILKGANYKPAELGDLFS